ncbi:MULTISPECIES: NirD/YgiW/YdeI family stress tolerance protein [Tenebrionibacter/Tenebrionicola group]|jgi:uncharacterized protein (TIGR00156 family)|uniref:NirD/YgiW/YdeI family stress tolerance protein n=2 Tax=Tenebrionibacter/Tenebrionicola group TaxID=2969848 RepID=A0A8K0V1B7_9ENTR|nr:MULTISPECIES: NirD/YgiW/YdeI family stress tolerance protein [Tenebrionibacter/Tenebrionicola group]MBK4715132.1 NirD/YgiW/YdeI family stress tolerance protein [Tenebrionibacter intestinalis]MBV5095903.1 NirD/YgiW/YdeI family stress tolerance protein [Tenebrionicola larvae]
MKKYLLLTFGLLCMSTAALATRPSQQEMTVRDAKAQRENAHVVVEGKITGRAGQSDRYWLRDGTGRILINVERCNKARRLIGRQVRVVGKIGHENDRIKIEAKTLNHIK